MRLRSVVYLFADVRTRMRSGLLAHPNGDPRWQQLDGQYARIERATVANNAQQLFAVYAHDFEAHMFSGEVWSFKRDQDLRGHRRRRMAGRQSPWTPVGASIRALRGCETEAGARGIVPTLVLVSELVQSSR
jgi:hypothetical protein